PLLQRQPPRKRRREHAIPDLGGLRRSPGLAPVLGRRRGLLGRRSGRWGSRLRLRGRLRFLLGGGGLASIGGGRHLGHGVGNGAFVLALRQHDRNRRIDLDAFGALLDQDSPHPALVYRLDFRRRLVSLDLGNDVARRNLVTLLDEPLGELALFHGRR